MDYHDEAKDKAKDIASELTEEMLEFLKDEPELSDDLLNDYPNGDNLHNEIAVDEWYDLSEAAKLLEELSEFEEWDSGLWDGQNPRDAISTQAAFTMGNAVSSYWRDLIREINGNLKDVDLDSDVTEKWLQQQIDDF